MPKTKWSFFGGGAGGGQCERMHVSQPSRSLARLATQQAGRAALHISHAPLWPGVWWGAGLQRSALGSGGGGGGGAGGGGTAEHVCEQSLSSYGPFAAPTQLPPSHLSVAAPSQRERERETETEKQRPGWRHSHRGATGGIGCTLHEGLHSTPQSSARIVGAPGPPGPAEGAMTTPVP